MGHTHTATHINMGHSNHATLTHRGKPGFVACAAEPISGESGLHTLVVSAVFPAPSHLFAKIISKSRSKSRLPLDIWEKASYLEGALFARPGVAEISKCMVGNLRVGLWVCARLPLGRFELSCPPYCVCVEICVERGAYRRSTVLAPVTCSVALSRSPWRHLGPLCLVTVTTHDVGRGGSRCVIIDEAL